MKICTYCDTSYALEETKCPSCGASDFKIDCDDCHTIHSGDSCPNCGKSIVNKLKSCPKCGHQTSERVCPSCGHDSMSTIAIKDSVASVVAIGACKLTGHKWIGCKCTRCGKTRDVGHEYKPISNKCEHKCSICGDTKELPHNWKNGTCERCGAKKDFIDKSWDSVGQKVPFLHLEKGHNRSLVVLVLIILSSFILLGIMDLFESTPNSNGEISLPYVLSYYENENFENVVNEVEEAGFTNIKTVASGDLILGWLNKEGEVASVTVGGKTEFETSDRYASDIEIVIEYHSFPIEGNNESQTDISETYVYNGQEYEIVDSYETDIGLIQYWIYTNSFDYSSEEYKQKVKEIITDLVMISKTTDLIIEIVTDKEIIYFESNNTIIEYMNKYGDKYYKDTIVPKEKVGYLASYTGGYDFNASQKSTEDSVYEVIWFIASDDPEFEKWKPELIP